MLVLSAMPGGDQPISLEGALVRRARRGDARAFRLIFDRHVDAVRRFLTDLLRDPAAADEATQEVFVRAHRMLDKMREDTKLRSWLLGIARNVFYEQLRAKKRNKLHTDIDRSPEASLELLAPTPRDEVLEREANAMLAVALEGLGAERRTALLLRLDHGLGYPEIAEHMGWNLAKVKNEIHRARLELRKSLAAYLGDVS